LGTISLLESNTEEGVIIVDVRDLKDGERDVKKVIMKIQVVTGLLAVGQRVALRCVGGINRSNTIALTVMCYINPQMSMEESWDHHYNILKSKVPQMHLQPDLVNTCKKALLKLGRW
jgi:hypothetical protein